MNARTLRLRNSTLLFVACVCLTGCDTAPPPELSDRWARRVVPFEQTWRRESQIPKKPQKSPKMVLWELSELEPGTTPSAEQEAWAKDFVEACYRAALENGWYDFKKGLGDGYQLMFQDRRHYENREFILDDRVLDAQRPEFLMYYGTPKGKRLSGFMFYVDKPLARGPQPGGNLSIWHYHVWKRALCLRNGLTSVGISDESGGCKEGTPSHRSPEMLHVWLIDHPEGAFTTSMMIEPTLFASLVDQRMKDRPETKVAADDD
ncbi:MAG: hypothetical protein OSB60_15510 [Myxococcota bacterium]|nr:hypothetical protein [Myxococcota bacterium]